MSSNKAVIVISTGDPAGIGPEITRKALKSGRLSRGHEYIVVGRGTGWWKQGTPSAKAGRISIQNLENAVKLLKGIKGRKALVTAPINKFSLEKAGYRYMGHTEILARWTHAKDAVMMFSAGHFKVALATRHIPLKDVSEALSSDNIVRTASLFYDALARMFGVREPRIGIAGLNPHAGESGVLGDEESRIIRPAVKRLRARMKTITGPWPADVLFRKLYLRKVDGVVAMYHDQGLVPFKMLYFDVGVNITLGLPFIRTSPDHGTAYDIAGKGVADASSMIAAIDMAGRLAR